MISTDERHPGGPVQSAASRRGRTLVPGQGVFETTPTFSQMALPIPEERESSRQAQPEPGFVRRLRAFQGRTQVVVLSFETGEPILRVFAQVRLCLLGEGQEV